MLTCAISITNKIIFIELNLTFYVLDTVCDKIQQSAKVIAFLLHRLLIFCCTLERILRLSRLRRWRQTNRGKMSSLHRMRMTYPKLKGLVPKNQLTIHIMHLEPIIFFNKSMKLLQLMGFLESSSAEFFSVISWWHLGTAIDRLGVCFKLMAFWKIMIRNWDSQLGSYCQNESIGQSRLVASQFLFHIKWLIVWKSLHFYFADIMKSPPERHCVLMKWF